MVSFFRCEAEEKVEYGKIDDGVIIYQYDVIRTSW